jgi:hypothetical protein
MNSQKKNRKRKLSFTKNIESCSFRSKNSTLVLVNCRKSFPGDKINFQFSVTEKNNFGKAGSRRGYRETSLEKFMTRIEVVFMGG